jgi:hypothetical protein
VIYREPLESKEVAPALDPAYLITTTLVLTPPVPPRAGGLWVLGVSVCVSVRERERERLREFIVFGDYSSLGLESNYN